MEQTLPNYNLPEYTSNTGLNYNSKNHSLNLNGLSMDPMPALPEDCSNESLYCPTPTARSRSPDFEHTRSLMVDDDLKTNLFGRHSLCPPFENNQNSFHMEGSEIDRINSLNDSRKNSNEVDGDMGENESGNILIKI